MLSPTPKEEEMFVLNSPQLFVLEKLILNNLLDVSSDLKLLKASNAFEFFFSIYIHIILMKSLIRKGKYFLPSVLGSIGPERSPCVTSRALKDLEGMMMEMKTLLASKNIKSKHKLQFVSTLKSHLTIS